METSFSHLFRTNIPGVICDFFISLTFTFSPSANPVYSISKNIRCSTASLYPHCSPLVQATVISLLDYSPSSSTVSAPSLPVRTCHPSAQNTPVKFHLIQDKSKKIKILTCNPEGSLWHHHPHCHHLSDFLSCHSHSYSLHSTSLVFLSIPVPKGLGNCQPLCLECFSPDMHKALSSPSRFCLAITCSIRPSLIALFKVANWPPLQLSKLSFSILFFSIAPTTF